MNNLSGLLNELNISLMSRATSSDAALVAGWVRVVAVELGFLQAILVVMFVAWLLLERGK